MSESHVFCMHSFPALLRDSFLYSILISLYFLVHNGYTNVSVVSRILLFVTFSISMSLGSQQIYWWNSLLPIWPLPACTQGCCLPIF